MIFHYRFTNNDGLDNSKPFIENTTSWLAISYGEIYLDLPVGKILQYSTESRRFFFDNEQYCSYYLARFIGDLVDIIPAIAIELPSSLEQYVDNYDSFMNLRVAITEYLAISHDELPEENITNWISRRALLFDYLVGGPTIWFFRIKDNISILWKSDHLLDNKIPLWKIPNGQCLIPYEDFKCSLKAFGKNFFYDMDKKIEDVCSHDSSVAAKMLSLNSIQNLQYHGQVEAMGSLAPTSWTLLESAVQEMKSLKLL